jgi:hypothetical protein
VLIGLQHTVLLQVIHWLILDNHMKFFSLSFYI